MRVLWATPDPAALERRLAAGLGIAPATLEGARAIGFPSGEIVLFEDASPGIAPGGRLDFDRRSLAGRAVPTRPVHPGRLVDLIGVGWGTVELERAVREFAPLRFGSVVGDDCLGARARVGRTGAASLALLEPSTEGRLAAALARSGEGPVAIYLAAAPGGLEPLAELARRTGERARIADGPFGRSFAVASSPWGPYILVCETIVPRDPARRRAGTIES